eukprot:153031-Prorocentrum_minimum.AAC.1
MIGARYYGYILCTYMRGLWRQWDYPTTRLVKLCNRTWYGYRQSARQLVKRIPKTRKDAEEKNRP